MIIDLLNNYPTKEQDRIIEVSKRWQMHRYHRGTSFDLYKEYPDAPYWGEGECEYGDCVICTNECHIEKDGQLVFLNCFDEDEERCEEYSDKQFYEWFDKIINEEEKKWIEDINIPFDKQLDVMDESTEWSTENIDIDFRLLNWLNENNITYCIIKGLLNYTDKIYVKTNKKWFDLGAEYRLRFGYPTQHDISYAISSLGWHEVILTSLTKVHDNDILSETSKWIMKNKVGIVLISDQFNRNSKVIFEDEIDIMATKLRWMENDFDKI